MQQPSITEKSSGTPLTPKDDGDAFLSKAEIESMVGGTEVVKTWKGTKTTPVDPPTPSRYYRKTFIASNILADYVFEVVTEGNAVGIDLYICDDTTALNTKGTWQDFYNNFINKLLRVGSIDWTADGDHIKTNPTAPVWGDRIETTCKMYIYEEDVLNTVYNNLVVIPWGNTSNYYLYYIFYGEAKKLLDEWTATPDTIHINDYMNGFGDLWTFRTSY